MIWLTWRQFRAQAITGVAALAVFAILLAVTESHMSSLYATSGLTSCHGATCAGLASQFLTHLTSGRGLPLLPAGANAYVIAYFLSILVILIAPVMIGIFWGAPLIARELETGTCQLAWNQSITRTRWLTVKLALTGTAAMAVTEAFSLVQAWWAAPIGRAIGFGGSASILTEGRFGPFVFPTHGITPLGYAAFAFTLSVTAGVLVRRAIPAMAITLAIFATVQFITPLWVRPNLIPADQTIVTTQSAQANLDAFTTRENPITGIVSHNFALSATVVPGHPGAWIISSGAVNAAGQSAGTVPPACVPGSAPATSVLDSCLDSHGVREAISYQPASRYWPLQLSETAIYLVLALALAWYCFRRLDRRHT